MVGVPGKAEWLARRFPIFCLPPQHFFPVTMTWLQKSLHEMAGFSLLLLGCNLAASMLVHNQVWLFVLQQAELRAIMF